MPRQEDSRYTGAIDYQIKRWACARRQMKSQRRNQIDALGGPDGGMRIVAGSHRVHAS